MILHMIETGGPGGAEQMMLRLTDEYGRRGYEQMVCLRKDGWLADQVRSRGLDLVIHPLGRIPDVAWLREMRGVARARGVHAIHSHEFAMNVHGAMLGKLIGVPSVGTVHGKIYYGERAARRFAYRVASRFARLVAVSDDIRDFLIDTVGVRPKRVSMIPNGVDLERFYVDESARRAIRQRLAVEPGSVLLGAIGSYYPVKGHQYLIEAMPRILARHPTAQLVLAGQGPLENALREQAETLGIADRVNVCGYVEDVREFLNGLDIFVLPSLSEGMPLALLEAAATGRALVATRVGGIPEFLLDRGNGLLVPSEDPGALADALIALIGDPGLRRELGACAAAAVAEKWSLSHTAEAYLELLEGPKGCDDANNKRRESSGALI